jgi:hypothetical protein
MKFNGKMLDVVEIRKKRVARGASDAGAENEGKTSKPKRAAAVTKP